MIFKILGIEDKLKAEQDKIVEIQVFVTNYFHDKSRFVDEDTKNYLVIQPVSEYFKTVANTSKVSVWKSKRLFD